MGSPLFIKLALASFLIAWDYQPTPVPANIEFEVWHTTNSVSSTNWTLAATTTNLYWRFTATNSQEWFKVRARDTQSGLVSDWAK